MHRPAHGSLTRRQTLSSGLAMTLFGMDPGAAWATSVKVTESPTAKVRHGHLERLTSLTWHELQPRPVEVWLPPDYHQLHAAGQRFSVIYMHDGQMLWNASTTWNRQA